MVLLFGLPCLLSFVIPDSLRIWDWQSISKVCGQDSTIDYIGYQFATGTLYPLFTKFL